MPKKDEKESIVGQQNYNTFGTLMIVIEDNGAKDIIVEFQDEYKYRKKTTRAYFEKGGVKNPYDKSVYSIGYLGSGNYNITKNGRYTLFGQLWHGIIGRCYNKKYQEKQPTYMGCYVDKEWHNFQNCAKWLDKNYYHYLENSDIFGGTLCLDKDILIKGNKCYSKDNCVLIPQIINNAFTKRESCRGKYPIGVTWHKRDKVFEARCDDGLIGKQVYLGRFDNLEDAFMTYKKYKEAYLKRLADKFKEELGEHFYEKEIFKKIYDALYRYEVDIND